MTNTTARTVQCPNCNGRIDFDPGKQTIVCSSCGTELRAEDFDLLSGGEGGADAQDAAKVPGHGRHAVTGADFFDQVEWHGDTSDPISRMVRRSCRSCAAELVMDENAVATECPYCGNALVAPNDADGLEHPHDVIPFSVSKEDAQKAIAEHLRERPYLPTDFSEKVTLEHVRSVYVPYYRYDIRVTGDWVYTECETYGNKPQFRLHRKCGEASFSDIPVDGSSKFPDSYMEAISPFPFEEAKPPSAGYLAGHLAELPDETSTHHLDRVSVLAERGFNLLMNGKVVTQKRSSVNVFDARNQTSETRHVLTLVPVWVMHYEYEGKSLLVCVNGATGKCVSDLPISKPQTAPAYLKAACMAIPCLFLVATLAPAPLSVDMHDPVEGSMEMLAALLFVGVLLAGVVAPFWIAHKDVHKAMDTTGQLESAIDYVDSRGVRITKAQKSKKTYPDIGKAQAAAGIMRQ